MAQQPPRPKPKTTYEEYVECQKWREKGLSYRQIQAITGVHRSRIKRVLEHRLGKQPGPLPLEFTRARLEFEERVKLGLVPAPAAPVKVRVQPAEPPQPEPRLLRDEL